jgi:hypothetical protein
VYARLRAIQAVVPSFVMQRVSMGILSMVNKSATRMATEHCSNADSR